MNKTIVIFGYNTEFDVVNGAEANRKMREFAMKGDTPLLAIETRSGMNLKQIDKVQQANANLIDTADAIFVNRRANRADMAVTFAIGYAILEGKEVILSEDSGARLVWPKSKLVQQTIFDLMRKESTITNATED